MMFWGFLLVSTLGFILVKLGSYSVWMVVLSGGLKIAVAVIVLLAALLIWNRFIKNDKKVITVKPRSLT